KLLQVSPGFSPDRVWTANVQLPQKSYSTSASHASFFRNLVDRVASLPGIESASADISLPFSSGGFPAALYFPVRPALPFRPAASPANLLAATPDAQFGDVRRRSPVRTNRRDRGSSRDSASTGSIRRSV